MKTAISLPDPLFDAAEAFAASHSLTRSELYRRALAEFLDRATLARQRNDIADFFAANPDLAAPDAAWSALANEALARDAAGWP